MRTSSSLLKLLTLLHKVAHLRVPKSPSPPFPSFWFSYSPQAFFPKVLWSSLCHLNSAFISSCALVDSNALSGLTAPTCTEQAGQLCRAYRSSIQHECLSEQISEWKHPQTYFIYIHRDWLFHREMSGSAFVTEIFLPAIYNPSPNLVKPTFSIHIKFGFD